MCHFELLNIHPSPTNIVANHLAFKNNHPESQSAAAAKETNATCPRFVAG